MAYMRNIWGNLSFSRALVASRGHLYAGLTLATPSLPARRSRSAVCVDELTNIHAATIQNHNGTSSAHMRSATRQTGPRSTAKLPRLLPVKSTRPYLEKASHQRHPYDAVHDRSSLAQGRRLLDDFANANASASSLQNVVRRPCAICGALGLRSLISRSSLSAKATSTGSHSGPTLRQTYVPLLRRPFLVPRAGRVLLVRYHRLGHYHFRQSPCCPEIPLTIACLSPASEEALGRTVQVRSVGWRDASLGALI
ncbi:hypothetical protein BD414DRAFT_472305, partial [Trametes punicea]